MGGAHFNEPITTVRCYEVARWIRQWPLYSVCLNAFMYKMPLKGLAAIMAALSSSPELRILDIRNNFNILDDVRFLLIRNMLLCSRRLMSVDIWACDFYGESPQLRSLVRACSLVSRLNLSQNFLYKESRIIECAQLLRLLRLRSLRLETLLSNTTSAALREFGPAIQKIRELDLSRNALGALKSTSSEDFWRVLVDQLALSEIEKLDLQKNELCCVSTPVWRLLGQAFSHMKYLKKLDLRGNDLSRLSLESRKLLADGLIRNPNSPTLIIDTYDDPDGFWKEKTRFGSFKVSMK